MSQPEAKKQKTEGAESGAGLDPHVDQVLSLLGLDKSVLTNLQPAPKKASESTSLAPFIDHTLLKSDSTEDQVRQLCDEAREHGFASVCVNGCWVPFCHEQLKGCPVKVCTVVGFPLGCMATAAKAYEAKLAAEQGAGEVDMVLNVGHLKQRRLKDIYTDVKAVVDAVPKSVLVKVILEICLLTEEQVLEGSLVCALAGAAFVKTSTGFSTHGATLESVTIIKRAVGDLLEVKAAGGVKTYADAQKYIEAGVTRIGTSSGIALLKGGDVKDY